MPKKRLFFFFFTTSSLSFLQCISQRTIFNFLQIGANLKVLVEACVPCLSKPYILTISHCVLLSVTLLLRQKKQPPPPQTLKGKELFASRQDTFGQSNVQLLLTSINSNCDSQNRNQVCRCVNMRTYTWVLLGF